MSHVMSSSRMRPAGDAGFSIIELMVSMLVLLVVSGIVPLLVAWWLYGTLRPSNADGA